jgi:hypothetical protein
MLLHRRLHRILLNLDLGLSNARLIPVRNELVLSHRLAEAAAINTSMFSKTICGGACGSGAWSMCMEESSAFDAGVGLRTSVSLLANSFNRSHRSSSISSAVIKISFASGSFMRSIVQTRAPCRFSRRSSTKSAIAAWRLAGTVWWRLGWKCGGGANARRGALELFGKTFCRRVSVKHVTRSVCMHLCHCMCSGE